MSRMEKVTSFIVMDILKQAANIPDVIHFEVGEPDISPSPRILKALKKAVKNKKMHYIEALGLPALRERISEFYQKKYNIAVPPERIIITSGTSGAFFVAYSILLNQGDRLAMSDPCYPCYKNFSYLLGIEPVFINVDKSTNYQLTVDSIKDHKSIKALQISSPANPTGNIYERENLRELITYCERESIYFISDEIYHGLVYQGQEHTALEFSEKAIVINGFSKYFCGPGLRLGWMILPEGLIRDAEKVLQNVFICAPAISQYGALEAFDYKYLDQVRSVYLKRRDYLYTELSSIFDIDAKPEGAFYLWANISKYSNNCFQFSKALLNQIHVAITPGIDFGKNKTEKYIRFAYTRETPHMAEGVRRLKEFLQV